MSLANKINNSKIKHIQYVCPPINELSIIINQVRCEECNLIFCNEPQFRMHDLKVHKRNSLSKRCKGNIRYQCPIKNCIYAPNNNKCFMLFKYLKQHYLKVHADRTFICTNCTKCFSTNAAKEAHNKICGIDFICECQKIFSSYEALLTHAKRSFHKVNDKYKSKKNINIKTHKLNNDRNLFQNIKIESTNKFIPIPILPKPTCDVAIQTEDIKDKSKFTYFKNKISKHQICRQTQTSGILKEKKSKRSAETQTAKLLSGVIRVHQVGKQKISIDKQSLVKEDTCVIGTLSSEYLLPNSLLPLRPDIILPDLWEDKNTLGTQTTPEKNIFSDLENYTTQNSAYHGISRSDPMLTEKTFVDKFNSIETQTEKAYYQSIFEADHLNSNTETQTTENFSEAIEPLHIYSNTCTQTCNDILSPDLELSDIQTQTAWSHLDDSTVSTETQTKALKCLSGCNDSSSWFTTQTNHMETQTDLLHIFEDI